MLKRAYDRFRLLILPSVELELALLSAMYASQSFLLPAQYGRDLVAWSLRVYDYYANTTQRDVCFSAPIQSRHASMRAIGLLYLLGSLFSILPHLASARDDGVDGTKTSPTATSRVTREHAQKAKHDAIAIKSTFY